LQEAELEKQLAKTKKAKAHARSKLENSLLGNFENINPYDWLDGICGCSASVHSSVHHQPNSIEDDWSMAPIKGSPLAPIKPWEYPTPSTSQIGSGLVIHRQPMGKAN
jgi:hypothetical protein